ncbi:MAG: hypothetical protein ACREEX_00370, partial [Caulobacteraceae bacterium]
MAGAVLALVARPAWVARIALTFGCLVAIVAAILSLPSGTAATRLLMGVAGAGTWFTIDPSAAWLLLFGLLAAIPAVWLGSPSKKAGWSFGAAAALIGALGVFGVQDGVGFLVAWELMSLGGALMILSERLASETGRPVLFMLALLEVGSVALMLAFLVWAGAGHSFAFSDFARVAETLSPGQQLI